jgi:hypothetical protein
MRSLASLAYIYMDIEISANCLNNPYQLTYYSPYAINKVTSMSATCGGKMAALITWDGGRGAGR